MIDTPTVADMLEDRPELMADIAKQQPIKRFGRAKEIAAAGLWFCSPAADTAAQFRSRFDTWAVTCDNAPAGVGVSAGL
ncbi:hypothetical protein [Streptomyces tibetensis]|uniref:hypothetical protein n=1 Tax=Streptomyces tibetensis TaxID=2382123 RepID=UPI0033E2E7E3